MASVDLKRLARHMDLPRNAELLLSKPEKEITFNLTLLFDGGDLLQAPCYVVYYNTARGPAKGGIRMSPNVSLAHTRELAETMVWKNALVGIPFGGGKSAICLAPEKLSRFQKTAVIKEFVHVMGAELTASNYIPAPDMGTNPFDMAVIYGETHILESVTGKPPSVGGLPGRKEATGKGVAHAVSLALKHLLRKKTGSAAVAVQGFGNVGSWAAKFISDMGVKVVAVSDTSGGVYSTKGLDIDALMRHAEKTGCVKGFPADEISNAELLELDVDVLVPAACEDVITKDNARKLRARLVIEAANGPTTHDGDSILNSRGIPVLPDILCNSGGVIASYVEWRKAKSGSITKVAETYATIVERVEETFFEVVKLAKQKKDTYRTAAQMLALGELVSSMKERGWV